MSGWGSDPYGPGPYDPYAGQPQPGYPPPVGYPGAPDAPVPMYQPYPNPGSWEPAHYIPRRGMPGVAVAGTILGYLLAAALLLTGLFLMLGASVIASLTSDVDNTVDYSTAEFLVAGLANWISAGLLIAGGVMVSLHRPSGRILFLAGSGVTVLAAVYWIVRFLTPGIVVWAILFTLLAGAGAILILQPRIGAWLAAPTPAARPPAPYPTDQYGRPFGS